jgi:hypothetical protein
LSTGKLYKPESKFIAEVEFKRFIESDDNWAGEFVLTEYKPVKDEDGYIIELEDGRRGRCSIRRRINRAVSSVPPLFHYHFRGYQLSD